MTRRRVGTFALVALLVLSTVGMPVAAAVSINTSADEYPTTYVYEDALTKETHDMETMSALEYENNNGDVVDLEAIHNGTTSGNDMAIRADRIAEDDFNQFPRKDAESGNNSASVMDASEWTSSGSAISISENDGATGSGVESLSISTTGMQAGTTNSTTYSNLSETSDPNKRMIQFVANINTLDAGTSAELVFQDGDGDEVTPEINASATSTTATDVIANSTANGVIYQQQVGDLTVEGTGDGTFNGIQKVLVRVNDGDVDMTITALNAERKSAVDFGTHRYQNADNEWTTETVENDADGGYINITSVNSLGETFSDATVNKLKLYNLHYRLEDQPDDYSAEIKDADEVGGYPSKLVLEGRIQVETAYELSHGNLELRTYQSLPGDRFQRLRYAEGVGDTATSEIADSSWVDASGSLTESGTTITLDATGQSGVTYVVQVTPTLLDAEVDSLQSTGGGGFWGGSGGSSNPFMSVYNWIVGGVVGLLTTIGIMKRGG